MDAIVTLTTLDCADCAIAYAVPERFMQARRQDHTAFYCPVGHSNHFPGKSREEQLQEQLNAARARARHEADQREAAERTTAAYKGHLTRARKKAGAGVCPVPGCKRHFENLARHMASKHPEAADA